MLADSSNATHVRFGKSVKGLNWKLEESCERTVRFFIQRFGTNEVLAQLLYNRGLRTAEEVEQFLHPKLKNSLLDPFQLKDIDIALERIIQALKAKQKICVFGDYDVDGATSSAVLRRFFRSLKHEIGVYIPNRLKEGYGPNIEAMNHLKAQGYQLIITVDCGTVSFEPIAYAKKIGLDVIVIDHHLGIEKLPDAIAVVNPNRLDETFPFKSIAAVGVVFLTIIALRTRLRELNWFQENNIVEPDLMQLLDLVALGTVCDVMLLKGINRAFVTQGLKVISKRTNLGLATLANISKLDAEPKAHHLGYVFGPRINAGGRVGEGLLGSDLLTTEDPQEAMNIATKLEQFNDERRRIESIALEEALTQIEVEKLYNNPMIFVSHRDWHMGILGILASKIKEKFSKPTGIMVIKEGVAKGSARSIPGFDLGTAFANAKAKGLLLEGGGHAMAGGFTIEESNIPNFCQFIFDSFSNSEEAFAKARELNLDYIIRASAINRNLIESINRAAPFGNGNNPPKFALYDVKVSNVTVVGADHLMVIIGDNDPASGIYKTQKCILYKGAETEMGQILAKSIGKRISLAGSLQSNIYDPGKVDFVIEDVAIKE